MAQVVYHPRYNFGLFGLESWLPGVSSHPFDTQKYARAWRELRRALGSRLRQAQRRVDRPASDAELRLAHSPDYLTAISHSKAIAAVLETPALGRAPGWLLRWRLLTPMRWAVRGTILAAQAALEAGVAINLGGGFHHAEPERGGGFCFFSDIAISVRHLRAAGLLAPDRRIVYVDLDAHQGNGVMEQFRDDPSVFLFDMYNAYVYPWAKLRGAERLDCDLPLRPGCTGRRYLAKLREALPGFLDSTLRAGVPFGIYNAGTDVVQGDPLGGLALSPDDVLTRDLLVIDEFRRRGIPVVMLTSGGYTRESFQLIAASVRRLLTSP